MTVIQLQFKCCGIHKYLYSHTIVICNSYHNHKLTRTSKDWQPGSAMRNLMWLGLGIVSVGDTFQIHKLLDASWKQPAGDVVLPSTTKSCWISWQPGLSRVYPRIDPCVYQFSHFVSSPLHLCESWVPAPLVEVKNKEENLLTTKENESCKLYCKAHLDTC